VLFESLCVSPLSKPFDDIDNDDEFNPVFEKPMESYPDEIPIFPIFIYDVDGIPPIRPNQTKVVSPRQKMLEKMGRYWLKLLTSDIQEDDLIEVMWYECDQTRKTQTGPWTRILS